MLVGQMPLNGCCDNVILQRIDNSLLAGDGDSGKLIKISGDYRSADRWHSGIHSNSDGHSFQHGVYTVCHQFFQSLCCGLGKLVQEAADQQQSLLG